MPHPSYLALAAFVGVCFVVALSGVVFKPGAWYRALRKPSWTPPNRAFPAVWTVLYIMIAVSGWLVWGAAGLAAVPFTVYGVQLVLNALWSGLFFGLRRPDLAFADIVALWLAIALNIAVFAPISAAAAWLLVPYLAWVTVAAALNRSVWRRNPGAFAKKEAGRPARADRS